MGIQSNIPFSDFFAKGQYETQAETLAIDQKPVKLVIGIPKEFTLDESRVSIVPNSIRTLIGYGHSVVIESGAGNNSNYSDHDYSEAGGIISHSKDEVMKSDIVVKISPATIEEIEMMRSDKILISPLQLPIVSKEYLQALLKKKVTALAMEYLQSDDGHFPIVRIMSEIAGMSAILTAGELLSNRKGGRGILLGGISGVPPAKVVILGAGVAAEFAIKTAMGLGASIRVFDNDVTKLMRLQNTVGRQLHTSSMNPVYLGYQLTSADVVIGAIHSKHGRAPIVVTEDMVSNMKEGSVIIDISIDQGGCFETSEMTTLQKPTFVKHGVIHYCVPNIASQVSRTSSAAVSNIITPLIIRMGSSYNIEQLLSNNVGICNGCYTYKGCLTNQYLSSRFSLKYTDLSLILTSSM